MAKFDLIKEIRTLLNELETVDTHDYNAVLSWFYKSIYFNNMYEDRDISKFVLECLKEFTDNLTDEEYYNQVRALLINSSEPDASLIARSLIAQIKKRLQNQEVLDENLIAFIRIYNERFNQQATNEIMMESLKKSIGENVIYVCIKDGQFNLKNGVMDSVEEYQSVNISGNKIPFIGYNIGIKTIYANDGSPLYNNPHLNNDSDLVEYSAIETLKKRTFGKAYEDLKAIKF